MFCAFLPFVNKLHFVILRSCITNSTKYNYMHCCSAFWEETQIQEFFLLTEGISGMQLFHNVSESQWGLCDGCLLPIGKLLYLLTEIYKLHDAWSKINPQRNKQIWVHICWKMTQKCSYFLYISLWFLCGKGALLLLWKRPFIGKPHSLQCSSILIGAYLGLHGPLSH